MSGLRGHCGIRTLGPRCRCSGGGQYEFFPVDSDDPVSWRVWANKVTREHQRRLSDGASHAIYTSDDVDTLRNGLRRFAEAFVREERPRAVGATFWTTNIVIEVEELDTMPVKEVVADASLLQGPSSGVSALGP